MGGQKSAVLDGGFERLAVAGFGAPVEKNLNDAPFIAAEFADVGEAGVSGAFPIDMPRAVAGLIGTDTVKVPARAALRHFERAGGGLVNQAVGARERFERGVDDGFPLQREGGGFAQETE